MGMKMTLFLGRNTTNEIKHLLATTFIVPFGMTKVSIPFPNQKIFFCGRSFGSEPWYDSYMQSFFPNQLERWVYIFHCSNRGPLVGLMCDRHVKPALALTLSSPSERSIKIKMRLSSICKKPNPRGYCVKIFRTTSW